MAMESQLLRRRRGRVFTVCCIWCRRLWTAGNYQPGWTLILVSNDMQAVNGDEIAASGEGNPPRSLPCHSSRVSEYHLPQHRHQLAPGKSEFHSREIEQLVAEMASEKTEMVVAYRGGQRWHQEFEALP